MNIRYGIKVSIANKLNGTSSSFPEKTLEANITAASDNLLYDNNHVIAEDVYLFDIFKDEVQTYSSALGVPVTELEFDSFEIVALGPPDKYRVYFEFRGNKQKQDLRPTIMVYIAPKNGNLEQPVLHGTALDKNSILWTWDNDGCAHYLVTEPINPSNPDDADKIVVQLPIDVSEYTEIGLDPGTAYTRRLISYTDEQYSEISAPCTVWTETVSPDVVLREYETPRLYDFTIDESQREIIEERMKAFHSGIGDFTDLKVYKQMDADFYQKFKAYFEITGRRLQRERRYDQVGFNYKICIDAMERIEEQEGEVTFDVYAYPREWLCLQDYVWATKDVTVQAQFEATVFLQKEESQEADSPITIYECKITHHEEERPNIHVPQDAVIEKFKARFLKKSAIIISLDMSTSMWQPVLVSGFKDRYEYVIKEACDFVDWLAKQIKKEIDGYNTVIQNNIDKLPEGDSQIQALKNQIINDDDANNIMQYIIVGWGGLPNYGSSPPPAKFGSNSAHCYYKGCKASEAIAAIKSIQVGDCGHYTNFYYGLTEGPNGGHIENGREVAGQLFFTDGFANVGKHESAEPSINFQKVTFRPIDAKSPEGAFSENANKVITSIRTAGTEIEQKHNNLMTYVIFSVPLSIHTIDSWYIDVRETADKFAHRVLEVCKETFKDTGKGDVYESGTQLGSEQGQLAKIFQNGVEKIFEEVEIEISIPQPDKVVEQPALEWDSFDGWGPTPTKIDGVAKYNLDSMVTVTVHGGPYNYVFKNSQDCTPVVYSRKEKRAVISKVLENNPNKNYYIDNNGNKVMILEEILRLVQETTEWQNGYQTLVKTSDGRVIVKGLFIKDNYSIGDEDFDYSSNWCNGMEGSVNSFTQVDHGKSDSYGDDCYLVDENSVLQVQGYTDAMIFDGEHIVSAELNAYDYSQVNAIHSNGSVIVDNNNDISCNTFMFNRKDNALQYDGNGPYSHCIDIVECDRDIILQGLNNPIQEETDSSNESGNQSILKRKSVKYQVFDPLRTDIIGKMDFWYRSPVLNYRFNIEDPDAKTSIYEILPDCHPYDNFLHVVLLHVYYARNVYITDGPNPELLNGKPQTRFNYVKQYGNDPIAYYNDSNLLDDNFSSAEGLYKWTQKMWQNASGYDNGWYLDDFVWFLAERMMKDIPYHDELPGYNMQPFYGLVNGRYTSKNQDGKQDLLVQVPQFNIPTTVRDYYNHYGGSSTLTNWNGDGTHPMNIYIVLTEFNPKDALVSYKWDKNCQWVNPVTNKVSDDITQDNKGCYATFSCDSVTYKDVEYYDLVQTINFENQEVFDTKNNVIHYQLEKPQTEYTYTNYYLNVSTDNGDVLPLNYPGEIIFDDTDIADFGVTYKGVVNATTKWSPRIHNGYYYLNQHEYFAYSEFNFDHDKTNVERNELEKCITVFGHMVFDVTLCHRAASPEFYTGDNAIIKNNRSALLQDENKFQWVNGKGVTLKPSVNGQYYKKYTTYIYYSPVLSFPNTLTVHGPVSIDFSFDDGTQEMMGVEIRSYVLEDGKWSDWYPLAGVETPCSSGAQYPIPIDVPLSHAYQLRFYLQASVTNKHKELDDYLCCYLDWKDDGEESACYNVVTVTDHMTTGPYEGKGIYVSKIFDFGCTSTVYLDMFQSSYKGRIKLYAAGSVDKDNLYVENTTWQDISNGGSVSGRYIRYKIEIPEGEKLYWLHKKIYTQETEAILPYVSGFKMEGEYHPADIITNFINTEAFEVTADGNYQPIKEFSDLTDIISGDVNRLGYSMSEIKKVDIRCTTNNIQILYNSNLLNEYPGSAINDTQLKAKTPYQTVVDVNYTPFIFLDHDDRDIDKITIYGATPQQYCPITVEDPNGRPYIQLHECTEFEQYLKIVCKDKTKYVEIPNNRYDYLTMKVRVNGALADKSSYKIVNHLIIFNDFLEIGDSVEISYYIMYSFIAQVERYGDNTTPPNTVIYLYTGHRLNANGELQYILPATKYKVYFETGLKNNKFVANQLSLNPIYRTDYKGFIYLTDDNNEPYAVKIYCNPRRIMAGGYDKVDVVVEVLDILGNPVINREVYLDCGATSSDSNSFDIGIINCDNNLTDMNGVVHFVYESSVLPAEAKIRASVFNSAGASIEDSITIVNE